MSAQTVPVCFATALQHGSHRDRYAFEYALVEKEDGESRRRDFVVDFLTQPDQTSISRYAANPKTFGKHEQSYRVQAIKRYDSRRSPGVYLDAEFGYALVLVRRGRIDETIAIMGFDVSSSARTVTIKQIQGGTTCRSTSTKEGRHALFKLDYKQLLYDMILEVAKRQGVREIKILTSKFNKWDAVCYDTTGRGARAYDEFARKNGHHSHWLGRILRWYRRDKDKYLTRKL